MAISTQQADAVTNAAKKYNVPQGVLWGVWGMETDFGQAVKTSSAGAVGDFQFLPSTARGYNYPLTNTPNAAQLQQQADAAAHYLSDLFKQHGSWDTALHAYSGGGYGLSQVQDKAANVFKSSQTPDITNIPVVGPAVQAGKDVAQTATDVAGTVGRIADLITSADFWLRIGEAIAGILLLYLGLHALTGQSSSAGQQVKHVTRIVPLPI